MSVLGWLVRGWLALSWVVLAVVALVLTVVFWPFLRAPRKPVFDITGKPFPDIAHMNTTHGAVYQRDEGDEDIATEGGFAWPGMSAIEAVRVDNPRLSDIQAYSVAKARARR